MRDLVEFAAREGHVIFQRKTGERVKLPVDWSPAAILERCKPSKPTPVLL